MAKSPPANTGDAGDVGSIPGGGKIPWRRRWPPTPGILAWEIPWAEGPPGLQSMGFLKSWTRLSDLTTIHCYGR